MRIWLALAALNGFLGVGAGAVGWHWLDTDEFGKQMFMMGAQYQVVHALALFGVAWLADRTSNAWPAKAPGLLFTTGIVFFSGSLYLFGATGSVPFAGSAPTGGMLLMAGWLSLLWAAWKAR